eukprot:scaffold28329_cov137-Skeletonema_menzelii.AAC.4
MQLRRSPRKRSAASDLTTKLKKYVELNWHVLPTTLPAGISLGRFHPRGLFNLLEYDTRFDLGTLSSSAPTQLNECASREDRVQVP